MAELILSVKPTRSFFVYLHRRATDGSVFYVGKGCGRRAIKTAGRSAAWNNIVKKHGFIVEYVERDIQEWYAFELELSLIALYGRASLCNLTDGGEGMSGHVKSENARKAVGAAHKGAKRTEATKKAISDSLKGLPKSADTRRKISKALKGRPIPTDQILRMTQGRIGLKRSATTKAAMSASWSDPKRRAERCAAMAAASSGRRVQCVETGAVFERMSFAANWLRSLGNTKAKSQSISAACSGHKASAYGYRWTYAPLT